MVCSACMIVGHFPNTCYNEFLKVLKNNGLIFFTIRDIYLDEKTDNEMNYK